MGLSGAQYLLRFIISAACSAYTIEWFVEELPQLMTKAKDRGQKVEIVAVDTMCFRIRWPKYPITSRLIQFCEKLIGRKIYPVLCDDGQSNVKERNTADYTDHRVKVLDVYRAAEGANSPVVRALPGSGSSDANDAAERLRSGHCSSAPAPSRGRPLDCEELVGRGFVVADTLQGAYDAIKSRKGMGVHLRPTLDADAVLFLFTFLFHGSVALASGDLDMVMAGRTFFFAKGLEKMVFLSSPYDENMSVKVLWIAWLLMGGNDFMSDYVYNCHRTNQRNEKFRKGVPVLLDKMMSGEERIMTLDEFFRYCEATQDQQYSVMFALIMYLDGPCYIEFGRVRRIHEAIQSLVESTDPAAIQAHQRRAVLMASRSYKCVEALIAAVCADKNKLSFARRIMNDLQATAPQQKEIPIEEQVGLELARFEKARFEVGRVVDEASVLDSVAEVADAAIIKAIERQARIARGDDVRKARLALPHLRKLVDEVVKRSSQMCAVVERTDAAASYHCSLMRACEDARTDDDLGLRVAFAAVDARASDALRQAEERYRGAVAALGDGDVLRASDEVFKAEHLTDVAGTELRSARFSSQPTRGSVHSRRALAEEEVERRAAAQAERRAAAERGETNQNRADAARKQQARQRAERAAQSGGAGEPEDPVVRWTAAVARTSPAGPSRNQCVMVSSQVSMLTPPEGAGEAPEFESCQNFTRNPIPRKKGVGANCSMCGCANKGTLTSPNVEGVHIAGQVRDVCDHCIGEVWRHVATGYYLRFCKAGCKSFRHVHEFALGDGEKPRKGFDPFTTSRCCECRATRSEKRSESRARKRSRE